MDVFDTKLSGVKKIQPVKHADERGAFMEAYQKERYREAGIDCAFVQENFVTNKKPGTVRGLHFQKPPAAQAKLITVVHGAILDVVVDIRHGSPTFAQAETFHLTAEQGMQVYLPAGFAHGYCTLEANTGVLYQVSAFYAPEAEAGIVWNDPDIAIDWPFDERAAVMTERDKSYPRLAELEKIFSYE